MALINVFRLLAGAESCNPGTHAYGYCIATTSLVMDTTHMLDKQTGGYICERLMMSADSADMIRVPIDANGNISTPKISIPVDHRLFLVVSHGDQATAFMGTPSRCLAAFLTAIYGGPMQTDNMWQRPITNFGSLPLQVAPLLTAVMQTVPAPTVIEQLVRLFDGHYRPPYIPPRDISTIQNPCAIYRKDEAGNLGAFAILMYMTKDVFRRADRRILIADWIALNEYVKHSRPVVIDSEQWSVLVELGLDDHGPLVEMIDAITKTRVAAFETILRDIEIDNPHNGAAAVCRRIIYNLAEILSACDDAGDSYELTINVPASLHSRVVNAQRVTWQSFIFGLLAEDHDIPRALAMLDIYKKHKDEVRVYATDVGVQPFAFDAAINRAVESIGVVTLARLDQNGRAICYVLGTLPNIEVFCLLCVTRQISKRSIPTHTVTPSVEHVLSTWWQLAVNSNEPTCTNADLLWRECLVPADAQLDMDSRKYLTLKDCRDVLAMALHATHKIVNTPAGAKPWRQLVDNVRVVAYLWSLLFTTELASSNVTAGNDGFRSAANLAENLRYKTVSDMLAMAVDDIDTLAAFYPVLAPGSTYKAPWLVPKLNMKFGALFIECTGRTSSVRFWPGCEPAHLRTALAVFVQACMGAFEPSTCLVRESPSTERTATTWAHTNDDRHCPVNLVEAVVVDGVSDKSRPGISGTLSYLLSTVPWGGFVRKLTAISFPRND